ncbi:MAG: hypothetical protein ACREL7_04120 [Longimicrobiales bacterium]
MAKRADSIASTSLDANREETDTATLHGTRLGTPGWMSPEQQRGESDRIDPRTDIYSLGAILHFLLGAPPGSSNTAVFRKTPPPLRAICARAMAPLPAGTPSWLESMLPGSFVGLIVGYATQKYGRRPVPA